MKKYTTAHKLRACALADAGLSNAEIAHRVGASESIVYKWIGPRPKPLLASRYAAEIRVMYVDGLSYGQMSARLSVSVDAIRRYVLQQRAGGAAWAAARPRPIPAVGMRP